MIDPDYDPEDEGVPEEDLFEEIFKDMLKDTLADHGLRIDPAHPTVPQHILDELAEGDGIHLTPRDVQELYGLPPLEQQGGLPTVRHQQTPRSIPTYTPRRPYHGLPMQISEGSTTIFPRLGYRSLDSHF